MKQEMKIEKIDNSCLIQGDCIEAMRMLIEKGVKVDAIITDPPYGTTACRWDSIIPFDKMWECLNKIIKDNGAIVLFGSEPFSTKLRISNLKNYKYDWIWNKKQTGNPFLAKKQPLKIHENISVFNSNNYNPIMREGKLRVKGGAKRENVKIFGVTDKTINNLYYPTSIIEFTINKSKTLHPTQKPVALMEYLVKTYTNDGDLVLDFTMGSGTTGVACRNTGRKFIGIELDENYYQIAFDRIQNEAGKEYLK